MSKRSRLTIPNVEGLELDAVLIEPQATPSTYALYAHCFTCTKEIAAAVRISQELASRGVAVLRFDFAGLGRSGGDFSKQTFTKNVLDIHSAAKLMGEDFEAPRLLIGHSLGGAAVLAAAESIESTKAVVTIGAPSEPEHVQRLFEDEVEKIARQGRAEVRLAGRDFTITREFVDDIHQYDLKSKLQRLGAALLILHSPQDRSVDIEEAAKIYWASRHPKSFVALEGADHLLSSRRDAQYAAELIAAWASRYVGLARPAGES